MLKMINISAAYHEGHPILSDVNLDLKEGKRIAVMGRNGIGKTTLANSVFGLIPFIEGDIRYRGRSIAAMAVEHLRGLGLGYYMQGAPVFPQMTVKDNMRVSAIGLSRGEFRIRWNELHEKFALFAEKGIENMLAGSLSGGERSQLALAMAIFNKPSLLILDEPFAGLSPRNANHILQMLNEYQADTGASMIMIEQDLNMASLFCDEILVIRNKGLFPLH